MSKSKSSVICIVSGEKLGCRADVYAKRVAKAGSIEELERTYIGRNARNMLRTGKTVTEIREELGTTDNLPDVPADLLETLQASWANKPLPKKTKAQKKIVADDALAIDPDIKQFFETGLELLPNMVARNG